MIYYKENGHFQMPVCGHDEQVMLKCLYFSFSEKQSQLRLKRRLRTWYMLSFVRHW